MNTTTIDTTTTTETEPAATGSLTATEETARAIIASGKAVAKQIEAAAEAAPLFIDSAKRTAALLDAGVTAQELADEVKAWLDADPALKAIVDDKKTGASRFVYTNPASIGYHARTGRVLRLPGTLPEDITPIKVQQWVDGLGRLAKFGGGVAVIDAILSEAADQQAAAKALADRFEQAKALKVAAETPVEPEVEDGVEETEQTADGGSTTAPDIARYLKAATGPISKAEGLLSTGATPTPEDKAAAKTLIASLRAIASA